MKLILLSAIAVLLLGACAETPNVPVVSSRAAVQTTAFTIPDIQDRGASAR